MYQINLKEAETQLANLIEQAAGGEEVIITRNDGTAYKIVPICNRVTIPKFGSAKGLIQMSDDFDAPLEDFEEYAP
ncbi:type II toxin-antitoxin system Phd/YefM family antitoxin [Pseudanabaenaceae cyanobacterium LEGE 13415]|nr:type II toxin-antitoxin system Phd/YefM family antitoxin [Pseudanabaenaceae cyanobacterium LEGE 13415]